MASGDIFILTAADVVYATAAQDERGATPHPVLNFDAAVEQIAVFEFGIPVWYEGGGWHVDVQWGAAAATSGDVVIGVEWERVHADNLDIDADSFASQKTVTDTAPGTSGIFTRARISFSDGAEIDSAVASDIARLRIARTDLAGADTMSGAMQLMALILTEQ